MIFLNSIWLFALAALSIPVAIHLWNVKRGKTLKVGSISLIRVSSQNKRRSIKLNDLLLLLFRCLLLALTALVLAMPFWQRHNSSTVKGWVLIPKEDLKECYRKFKPTIDSLNKAGFEFHYFNAGFGRTDLNRALADTTNYKNTNLSYWSLIQQLDGQNPSTLPVYLFSSGSVSHFAGKRPQVSLALHWQTYTPAHPPISWLEKAWLTDNNDIYITEGNSKSSGTFYAQHIIRSGDQQTPFVVHAENGRVTVGLRNSSESIVVDTSTWRFAIYTEKNSTDAGYIKAALASIMQFTRHKAAVKQYTDARQITQRQSWVFWLSGKSVTQQLNCDNLFSYENGKQTIAASWMGESASKQRINFYRSITRAHNDGYSIWKDGFGEPVLSLQRQGQTNVFHFYNRFDPAWSDLVWSERFPKMLMQLIIGQSAELDTRHERRVFDAKQIMPVISNQPRLSNKAIARRDLSLYLWLLLVLIFAAERWQAHSKSPKQVVRHG